MTKQCVAVVHRILSLCIVNFLSYYLSKYDLHLIDFFLGFSSAIVENGSEGMRNVQILFKT